jgi:hypothetical protein
MDTERIFAATNAIRKALKDYAVGRENPQARRVIDGEIETLRYIVPRYVHETIGKLSRSLDTLFSAKKHQQRGRGREGVDAVLRDVLQYLDTIDDQVRRVDRDEHPTDE